MTGTAPLSLTLFWVAVAAYIGGLVGFVIYGVFRKPVIARLAIGAVSIGWPFHLSSIFARALEAGHWPLGNMFEYSTAISFVIVTAFLVLAFKYKLRLVGIPILMAAIALMGVGYMLYVPPGSLVPALHSYWLMIHVTSMATASGLLTVAFIFAALYLIRRWADNRLPSMGPGAAIADTLNPGLKVRAAGAIARTLPSQKTLDRWSYRFVALGFPIWTFGVICGAVWGEHAWGRYWGWDPKETFAFVTWVIFAVYLHARVTHGWREVRAAVIACLGFVSVMFTLYAVNLWIAGLHSYAKA